MYKILNYELRIIEIRYLGLTLEMNMLIKRLFLWSFTKLMWMISFNSNKIESLDLFICF